MWYGFGRFGHMVPWMTWVGPIFMVVFWALATTAVIFLIRYLVRHSRASSNDTTAMMILKERYAKGEIDKAEFEQKRRELA